MLRVLVGPAAALLRGVGGFALLEQILVGDRVALPEHLPLPRAVVQLAAVPGGDHAAHEPLPAEVDLRVPAVAVSPLALRRQVRGGVEPVERAMGEREAARDGRDP